MKEGGKVTATGSASGWPLARLLRVLYVDTLDRAALADMAALPALAQSWKTLAERRLARGAVEDWTGRLTGG